MKLSIEICIGIIMLVLCFAMYIDLRNRITKLRKGDAVACSVERLDDLDKKVDDMANRVGSVEHNVAQVKCSHSWFYTKPIYGRTFFYPQSANNLQTTFHRKCPHCGLQEEMNRDAWYAAKIAEVENELANLQQEAKE